MVTVKYTGKKKIILESGEWTPGEERVIPSASTALALTNERADMELVVRKKKSKPAGTPERGEQ